MFNISSAWRGTFQALRQDFERAAETHPDLRYIVVQAIDDENSIPPTLQREMQEAVGFEAAEIRARWVIPGQ
jgi:hypothetical protein